MTHLTGYKGNSPDDVLEGSGEGIFVHFFSSGQTRTRGFNITYETFGKIEYLLNITFKQIISILFPFKPSLTLFDVYYS